MWTYIMWNLPQWFFRRTVKLCEFRNGATARLISQNDNLHLLCQFSGGIAIWSLAIWMNYFDVIIIVLFVVYCCHYVLKCVIATFTFLQKLWIIWNQPPPMTPQQRQLAAQLADLRSRAAQEIDFGEGGAKIIRFQ